jgi:hypothetical protein
MDAPPSTTRPPVAVGGAALAKEGAASGLPSSPADPKAADPKAA